MAYAFDGPNKLIVLSPGTVSFSARDLWSRWVDWHALSDNSKFLAAMRSVGGDDIIAGSTSIPVYTYLTNGWRIRPQDADHALAVIDGILLVDGGGNPFVATLGAFNVQISYQQPVQAITVNTAGSSGPSAVDIAAAVRAELAAELARVDELHQIHGLESGSPLVVGPASRAAAAIEQTLAEAAGVVTVTRV